MKNLGYIRANVIDIVYINLRYSYNEILYFIAPLFELTLWDS